MHTFEAITKWENIYTNFKLKDHNFWKAIFKMTFLCSRRTAIQTLQYKIIYRTLPCNEWLSNIKIKSNNICTYCSSINSIFNFLKDCKANNQFWKGWAKWWHSLTGFQHKRLSRYTWINSFCFFQEIAMMPLP